MVKSEFCKTKNIFVSSQSCGKGNVPTNWYVAMCNFPSGEVVTKAEILEHF